MKTKPIFHCLYLENTSIFEQLEIEEALLRADHRNIFIISKGSTIPSIVLGISSSKEKHLYLEPIQTNKVPVIRRFSGGGTVVVDENTLFVTFIASRQLIHETSSTPESILRFAEKLFLPVFQGTHFALKENDFIIGEKKCGGNAEYLQKDRFLLHTSFLWDYSVDRFAWLKHPPKTPSYRKERSHCDFVCKLKDYFPCQKTWIASLQNEMEKTYCLENLCLTEVMNTIKHSSHRRSTKIEEISYINCLLPTLDPHQEAQKDHV